jgi:hypothetical protein
VVGSVHENLKYWKDTFEVDSYMMSILENGYKIPVNMSDSERRTRYRERNIQSAEVARLLADGASCRGIQTISRKRARNVDIGQI